MDSRVPRAAGMPYNAHAIASRIVDFPEPLGPMIPVSPVSNSSRVSTCWRKFWRCRVLIRTYPSSTAGAAVAVAVSASWR